MSQDPTAKAVAEPGLAPRLLLDDPLLADFDLDQGMDPQRILADLEARQRSLALAQESLERSQFTMQSGDGLFEVTVRSGAAIADISIHPEALRRYRATELGAQLVALISEAMTHGATVFRQTFSEVFATPDDFDRITRHWPSAGGPPAP